MKSFLSAGLLGLALMFGVPAQAASVVPLYLDEIVDQSAVAFQGTCTGNRSERDPHTGMVVTYTTFEVHDVLKGEIGSVYTVKQMGGVLPSEGLGFKMEGVPTFEEGRGYVVFFAGVSRLGFSSPIGLSQGRFSVIADRDRHQVTNGRDFKELTARMGPQALPKSAQAKFGAAGEVRELGLDEFKTMVRGRTGAAK